MKHIDEYRDIGLVKKLSVLIREVTRKPWTIMEICGGQTHAIMKYRLTEYLPPEITLVHGPGCPVCVTPAERIDQAIWLAEQPGVILASFGDMLRVPGSERDLLTVKAGGGDIRMVYSPLDALALAEQHPGHRVVFFGVGFETTAPATALAVKEAARRELENFFLLSAHVLVPPAIRAILSAEGNRIRGLLAAGHVCTVMGYGEYIPLAEEFRTPIVVTGFEPVDILRGILETISLLESGRTEVANAYSRAVSREGNVQAKALMREVFRVSDRHWRGIGNIPQSGLELNSQYAAHDASHAFNLPGKKTERTEICIAGQVLQGKVKPTACKAFGKECTPEHPLGAPMVSAEGACAAYYRYEKHNT